MWVRRVRTTSLMSLVLMCCIGIGSFLFSQNVTWGGFVKFDGIFDTRQVVSAREGHFLLYPKAVLPDADGMDLNANANLLMAMFQTRLSAKISAPDALGARVSGQIEGDFFGATNETVSLFRLRNTFLKLDWPDRELLIGQYWSPLFTLDVYPQTVSFNTGLPFQPFARHPQVRFTWKPGDVHVLGAFDQQRDAFEEVGLGRTSQQLAVRPGAHLHVKYAKNQWKAGVGLHGRTVRPELRKKQVLSGAVTAYAARLGKKVQLRAKAVYGSDMGDHLMLGGLVRIREANGTIAYGDTHTASAWLDVQGTTNPTLGVFAGYSENLGLAEPVSAGQSVTDTWVRGANISNVWRISPRVVYSVESLRFALEVEATGALYTSDVGPDFRPTRGPGDESVVNIRTLVAAYLVF